MTIDAQPYRRSIWDIDGRYAVELDGVSSDLLKKIALGQSIESAKKRTPPIPIADLVRIIQSIEELPSPNVVTVQQFQAFLEAAKTIWGAGVKTIICMLAVFTEGTYPPLDSKIALAAKVLGYLDAPELKAINGASTQRIADIYVNRLLPAWSGELQASKLSPRDLDNEWGRKANEAIEQ